MDKYGVVLQQSLCQVIVGPLRQAIGKCLMWSWPYNVVVKRVKEISFTIIYGTIMAMTLQIFNVYIIEYDIILPIFFLYFSTIFLMSEILNCSIEHLPAQACNQGNASLLNCILLIYEVCGSQNFKPYPTLLFVLVG